MAIRDVFSERLKTLRKEIGISQETFAESLGVARATLGYYEKGDRLPDIGFLDLVCGKTGCSMEYLMGYSENMKPGNETIGSETGLSDKAIDVLIDVSTAQRSDVLNFLIEHPRFEELLRSMKILSYHSIGKFAELIDENYREYKYYQASGIIREICQAAYNDPNLEKEPAFAWTIPGKQESLTLDPCEIGLERRENGFIDRELENNLTAISGKISAWQAEEHARAEKDLAQFRVEDAGEAERAKDDPVLRFCRRMTRTFPDGDGQKED